MPNHAQLLHHVNMTLISGFIIHHCPYIPQTSIGDTVAGVLWCNHSDAVSICLARHERSGMPTKLANEALLMHGHQPASQATFRCVAEVFHVLHSCSSPVVFRVEPKSVQRRCLLVRKQVNRGCLAGSISKIHYQRIVVVAPWELQQL